MSGQVTISSGASGDISKLAAGSDRAGVALGALKEERLNAAQIAELKALVARYPDGVQAAHAEPTSVKDRQAALLKEFGIVVVDEGKVRLSLGKTSRIDFLRKVQEVASELHGRPAIYASRLEEWASDAAFTNKPSEGLEIGVDGNVKGSTNLTRGEQESKGWNNVDLCDLAVAHAAYFLATGKDLFGGKVVRARGGALNFYASGLRVFSYIDASRYRYVAASSALPARN